MTISPGLTAPPAVGVTPSQRPSASSGLAERLRSVPSLGLLAVLIGLWVLAALFVPRFATGDNVVNVLQQSSDLMVAALGMMFVLMIGDGGIDLSVGSVYGLTSVVLVSIIAGTGNPVLGVVVALAVGVTVGLANGALVHWARVPAFITTLGMFYITLALAQMLSSGSALQVPANSAFQSLTKARIVGVPFLIVVTALVAVAIWFVLNRTYFGRSVQAVGFNRESARLSGIPVGRTVLGTFLLASALAALGAIMLTTRIQSGQPTLGGFTTTFEVITAAVVGGTSLMGGRGNVPGVLIGALILRTIGNCITLLNITPLLYQAVMGSLILVALIIEALRARYSGGRA
jgi:ribose transport system permease protein